jgi:hypothetical protein
MGWPSCFENDTEHAYDRRFMAGLVEDRFCLASPLPPKLRPEPALRVIAINGEAAQAGTLQTGRELHILCLIELRPKARLCH